MSHIVGLTGTHGTGKSTIIDEVRNMGAEVNDTQLSRGVQKALGWSSLSEAGESPDKMWEFQEAVLGAMFDRDRHIHMTGNKVVLVDRTPADVWAYVVMWCKHFGINEVADVHARSFKSRARQMMFNYSKFLYVPICDKILFKEEANRADNSERTNVDRTIIDFLWNDGYIAPITINAVAKEARAAEVYSHMLNTTFTLNRD